MRARFSIDHYLAGRSLDRVFVIVKKSVVHPKGHRTKTSRIAEILSDNRAACLQRLTEVPSQGAKKVRSGFRNRALDEKSQNLVLANS